MTDKDLLVGKMNLQINESIAKITSEIENQILNEWKINKQDIIDAINFKNKLIKYLEDKMNMDIENETEYGHARDVGMFFAYQDILERVKSDKYEI